VSGIREWEQATQTRLSGEVAPFPLSQSNLLQRGLHYTFRDERSDELGGLVEILNV